MENSANCYDVPQYWDLAFDDDTADEADFIEAAAKKYCDFPATALLEPGCGGGRLVVELSRRGYDVTGWDLSEQAASFANNRLEETSLSGRVHVSNMLSARTSKPVDIAYCLVNTFRHLLTEADAIQHLQTIAACVRPGGLYIIGMHMLPPDADEEDSEDWSVTAGETTVNMRLDVVSCDRETRLETLRFQMNVSTAGSNESKQFQSDYQMRLYDAPTILELLAKVPEFELLPEVYDFWYDIDEPLTLNEDMSDTVFILRRLSP